MKKIVKQVVAIDVAQKELVVCLGRMYEDLTPDLYARKSFANSKTGFIKLLSWVKKCTEQQTEIRFVMEATGVYHEAFAYFLAEQPFRISVILPNKISNYVRTLEVKTITDKTASEAIARFGLERKLEDWVKPPPTYKSLRQLTRERSQVIDTRTITKNQLHAENAEAQPNPSSVARLNQLIALLNKQEKQISSEIAEIVKKNKEIQAAVEHICSIPGVGLLTASTVLAETNGFDLIRNKRQLTSYAGLDVVEKQSGTSVKGKPKISKRGNKYLRKSMHLPALSAIKHDQHFKGVFARLVARHGIKMKAAVAVQRKLLELIYTLFKNNAKYDKSFLVKKNEIQPA